MNDINDIMIDIETLATVSDSVILSIAAVKFDRKTGDYIQQLHVKIKPNQPERSIDLGTVRWWLAKPEGSLSQALYGNTGLVDALVYLKDFVGFENVWSQGSDFDFDILEHAMESFNLKVPWHHTHKRDTRTAYDVCGFDPKSIPRVGTHHDALDDCRHQIKCVVAALGNRGAA